MPARCASSAASGSPSPSRTTCRPAARPRPACALSVSETSTSSTVMCSGGAATPCPRCAAPRWSPSGSRPTARCRRTATAASRPSARPPRPHAGCRARRARPESCCATSRSAVCPSWRIAFGDSRHWPSDPRSRKPWSQQRRLQFGERAGVDGGVVAELTGQRVEVDVVESMRRHSCCDELLGQLLELGDVGQRLRALAHARAGCRRENSLTNPTSPHPVARPAGASRAG